MCGSGDVCVCVCVWEARGRKNSQPGITEQGLNEGRYKDDVIQHQRETVNGWLFVLLLYPLIL